MAQVFDMIQKNNEEESNQIKQHSEHQDKQEGKERDDSLKRFATARYDINAVRLSDQQMQRDSHGNIQSLKNKSIIELNVSEE